MFKFNCNCGWTSKPQYAATIGPAQVVKTCSNCGNEEKTGEVYDCTMDEALEGKTCPECGELAKPSAS